MMIHKKMLKTYILNHSLTKLDSIIIQLNEFLLKR